MERESSLWTLFTKKEDFLATCNTCQKDYSYRASVSNLRKHWVRKHGGHLSNDVSVSYHNNDDSDDEEQEEAIAQISDKVLWRLIDDDKVEASCKICDKNLSSESMSEMAQHLQVHEEKPKGSDDKDDVPEAQQKIEKPVAQVSDRAIWKYFRTTCGDESKAICILCSRIVSVSELTQHIRDHGKEPEDSDVVEFERQVQQKMLKRKYKSKVWDYFEATDDKMAICLLCKKYFNFSSSISNLRKHLQRIHKEINLAPVVRRICINGEVYEIANEQEQEENEGNVETIEVDPIYLSNDSITKSTTPSPKEKHPKILPKRHLSKVLEEPVHKNKNTCSEILEHPKKEIPSYTSTTDASIDYFGQYVVSLLKELPKPVSDRLQSEIIKQIFTTKMALDSPTATASYEIKICKKDKNVTNVPEPVCYTVVQTNEATEKLNEVTGSFVKE